MLNKKTSYFYNKKLANFFILILISVSLFINTSFAKDSLSSTNTIESDQKILRIVGWDVYADPINTNKTIGYKKFEKKTGIVIHFTPLGNLDDIIDAADSDKNYDVFIISNEGIHTLTSMNLVRPIKTKKITNFKDLYPSLSDNHQIHPHEVVHAVPWAWGPTGLLYDTKSVASPDSWNALWDLKYKGQVSVWNDVSMIWITALSLGYNNVYNLTRNQLAAVKDKLFLLNNQVYDYYSGGEDVVDYIRSNNAVIFNSWFDPSARLRKEGHHLKMIIPKEGAVGMFDSYLISSKSEKSDIAHQFINSQLEPEVQREMTRITGLSPANTKTLRLLEKEEIKSLHLDEKDYFGRMILWDVMPRKHLYDQVLKEVREDLQNKTIVAKKLNLTKLEKTWLQHNSTVTFTGDPNWLPYEAFQKDGQYIGIVAGHLKLIENLTGIIFNTIPTENWSESLQIATEGKVSIISGDSADPILNQRFKPVDAYSHNPIVIIMNTNHNNVENLEEIKGKKIAIIKDYGYTADIYKNYPNYNFIEVGNIQSGLEGVIEGRFDAMLATLALASYHMAEMGAHNIKIVGKTNVVMNLTLFIDKNLPQLHSIITKAFKSISKSDSSNIFQQWTKNKYIEKTDYTLIIQIIIAAIFILFIFAFWNRRLSQEINLRKATEEKIEQSQARFEAMFQSIPDAIIYADPDRKIRLVNKATIETFGYESKELIGNLPKMLYASVDDFNQQDNKGFNLNPDHSALPYVLNYKHKVGQEFDGETLCTPVTSPSGELLGYLSIIRDISERTHAEEILRALAAGNSTLHFDSFLNDVLERLSQLYGCQYAFIGRLQSNCKRVKTLAVRANGNTVDNFTYSLKGTPCKDILDLSKEIIPKDASILYPEDQMLIDMGVDSYFGAPLISADGSILGILSVMDTNPLILDEWTEPVLGVFATRVALELERNLATEELKQHKEQLEATIKERTADLVAARDEAEHANASKTVFLSRMSHELRTPMNAILGFGQILEQNFNKTLSENDLSNITEILSGGYHLLELIDEVLDLSQVETGHLKLIENTFNLVSLVNESISLIEPLAKQSDISILHHAPDNSIMIRTDHMRFKQVVLNLLSNATKYNRPNGKIEINYLIQNNKVKLSVTDTGIGIPAAMNNRVFDPFDRLRADETSVEGTGIGLSLAKSMIEMMNGTIGFSSEEDHGSTFWVEIELNTSENVEVDTTDPIEQSSQAKPGDFTVLYVEDNPANLRLVSELLNTQDGIKLYNAPIASIAMDLINTHLFDLILLDIQLPGKENGFDILKKIRAKPSTKNIPVIAISANATEHDIQQGIDAGFDDYITKPIKIDHFLKTFNSYLS